MLIDAPGYQDEKSNDEIELTEDNADDVLRYMNNMM
jgi:hypothetical protein